MCPQAGRERLRKRFSQLTNLMKTATYFKQRISFLATRLKDESDVPLFDKSLARKLLVIEKQDADAKERISKLEENERLKIFEECERFEETLSLIYYRVSDSLKLFPPPGRRILCGVCLHHISLTQFSSSSSPSLSMNYFLPGNEMGSDLDYSILYLLLWKFEQSSENAKKTWYVNTFKTKSSLKLLRLSPSFNLSDALVRLNIKQGVENKGDAEIILNNLISSDSKRLCDGTWKEGERAVNTILEIALTQHAVRSKLAFLDSKPVDNFLETIS